jgi:NAD(P)-dependent dehydrogenase (short-subunit alcohol dehydrogenase family)
MPNLKDKVAIVTGASRGAGRGIAQVLGEAGAIVYVTGRSVRGNPASGEGPDLTIDRSAELVSQAGGQGIPIQCDHTDDAQVEALFDRVKSEQDKLDLLVNNIWGGYEDYEGASFDSRFWDQPMWRWDKMFNAGLRAHFTASRLAAPMMIEQKNGLILSTIAWDRGKYLGSLPYDTTKTAITRMNYCAALELKEHNVCALSLAPGFMRTEAVLEHFNASDENWQEIPDLESTESTYYVGRAVAELAADSNIMEKSGEILAVGDLASEYEFADVDGRVIPAFRIPDEMLWD